MNLLLFYHAAEYFEVIENANEEIKLNEIGFC